MPLRVGLDVRHAPRGLGIGVFVTELRRRLAAVEDVEVIPFGEAGPYPLLDSPLGRRAARRRGVDVFHFTGNTGWASRGPVPFVLTVHDLVFLDTAVRGVPVRQAIGHRYERVNVRRAVSAAAAVAVPSRATAAALREALAPQREPVVIPNGVEPLQPQPGASAPGAPPLAASRGDYFVAFSGRDPRKRLDLALDAVLALGPDAPRLIVLAGAGIPSGLEERLDRAVADGRAEVLGRLPRDELWRVLSGARALVYASAAEGFGLPVLEAMSVGVPVITGLAPATAELGDGAVLPIDPAEPAASITASLRRLLMEPELAAELAASGRRRAAEFSWDRTAERYAALYREVAGA